LTGRRNADDRKRRSAGRLNGELAPSLGACRGEADIPLDVLRVAEYTFWVIQSFRCRDTQLLYEGGCPKRFRAIEMVATRKLAMLDSAKTLEFLRSPPGNRLEALKGDRAGQWSIRINDQWRVCFVWTDAGPSGVEIVDYH